MGVNWHDAPQWFRSSFVRAARGAGATATDDELGAVAEALVDRWSGEDRHFHDLKHLASTLHRVDELAQETREADLVRLAAWYHGAVFASDARSTYDSRGGEQTPASAELARTELTGLGVPAAHAQRVASLVDSLLRHQPPADDVDAQVLNDADLSMLATEPQRYRVYCEAVRAEYAHIPPADFVRARIRILERLLHRGPLYTTPQAQPWEGAARQNVEAELTRLRKEAAKLAALPASVPAAPPE